MATIGCLTEPQAVRFLVLVRPQIACRARARPPAPGGVFRKSQATRKGAANSASARASSQGSATKGQAPTNPQGPPASGAGLLAAASTLLVTRIALGIVGIGFFGWIWMLLTAGFLFGLVLGLTWIHRFAHGHCSSVHNGSDPPVFAAGVSILMLWVMANCIADPAVTCQGPPACSLACRPWLGRRSDCEWQFGSISSGLLDDGTRALEEKLVAGRRVPSMNAQQLRS
jgi:hypothetical protein